MDKTEQKMFESIKELISSDLNVERIEGFEPHWWGNDNQDEAEAQPVQHNDSRSRRDDRNKRNEYANKIRQKLEKSRREKRSGYCLRQNCRQNTPQPSRASALRPAPTWFWRKVNNAD